MIVDSTLDNLKTKIHILNVEIDYGSDQSNCCHNLIMIIVRVRITMNTPDIAVFIHKSNEINFYKYAILIYFIMNNNCSNSEFIGCLVDLALFNL